MHVLLALIATIVTIAPFAQSPQTSDPLSGGAGWVGAGLLGLVLAWLLMKHLPAKDLQIKEFQALYDGRIKELLEAQNKEREQHDSRIKDILDSQARERDQERTSRHTLGQSFQEAVGSIHKLHVEERESDRGRFEERVRIQASEFREALNVILIHCQKESAELLAAFRTEMGKLLTTSTRTQHK